MNQKSISKQSENEIAPPDAVRLVAKSVFIGKEYNKATAPGLKVQQPEDPAKRSLHQEARVRPTAFTVLGNWSSFTW